MTTTVLILIFVVPLALVAAAAAAHAALQSRQARIELAALAAAMAQDAGLVGRSVMVSTTGESAVRGIVHAELEDRITLREAVVVTVGADAEAPASGLLHIYRSHVALVQELPTTSAQGSPIANVGG